MSVKLLLLLTLFTVSYCIQHDIRDNPSLEQAQSPGFYSDFSDRYPHAAIAVGQGIVMAYGEVCHDEYGVSYSGNAMS